VGVIPATHTAGAGHDTAISIPKSDGLSARRLAFLALLLLGVAVPFVPGLYLPFVAEALTIALFAVAFNLLIGYAGLLSFGHAAFFGMGAYVAAYAVKSWGLAPELGILAGTAVAAVLGLLFGVIAIRRQGIYFAMITLALAQLVYFFCLQAPFTNGEDGIQAVPRGRLLGILDLGDDRVMYYVVLAVFLAGFLLVQRIVHSPFGQVLKATRDNEPRAISLGYSVDRFKLVAFLLSAALAGLAGSLNALVIQIASLTNVHWHASGEVVLMTLVGGMGTLLGPVVGAILLTSIQNYFAEAGSWVTIIQGVIFVACVLLFRRGIVGTLEALLARRPN
jgi:branched-chain amino acid transport system permease protein